MIGWGIATVLYLLGVVLAYNYYTMIDEQLEAEGLTLTKLGIILHTALWPLVSIMYLLRKGEVKDDGQD